MERQGISELEEGLRLWLMLSSYVYSVSELRIVV